MNNVLYSRHGQFFYRKFNFYKEKTVYGRKILSLEFSSASDKCQAVRNRRKFNRGLIISIFHFFFNKIDRNEIIFWRIFFSVLICCKKMTALHFIMPAKKTSDICRIAHTFDFSLYHIFTSCHDEGKKINFSWKLLFDAVNMP